MRTHPSWIICAITVSSDCQNIAIGDFNKFTARIYLINTQAFVANGGITKEHHGYTEEVSFSWCFSPDGSKLACPYICVAPAQDRDDKDGQTMNIFNGETGALDCTWPGHSEDNPACTCWVDPPNIMDHPHLTR